ncbi:MAG: hypothetical protein ACJAW3_001172 [Lentimonas sp.]
MSNEKEEMELLLISVRDDNKSFKDRAQAAIEISEKKKEIDQKITLIETKAKEAETRNKDLDSLIGEVQQFVDAKDYSKSDPFFNVPQDGKQTTFNSIKQQQIAGGFGRNASELASEGITLGRAGKAEEEAQKLQTEANAIAEESLKTIKDARLVLAKLLDEKYKLFKDACGKVSKKALEIQSKANDFSTKGKTALEDIQGKKKILDEANKIKILLDEEFKKANTEKQGWEGLFALLLEADNSVVLNILLNANKATGDKRLPENSAVILRGREGGKEDLNKIFAKAALVRNKAEESLEAMQKELDALTAGQAKSQESYLEKLKTNHTDLNVLAVHAKRQEVTIKNAKNAINTKFAVIEGEISTVQMDSLESEFVTEEMLKKQISQADEIVLLAKKAREDAKGLTVKKDPPDDEKLILQAQSFDLLKLVEFNSKNAKIGLDHIIDKESLEKVGRFHGEANVFYNAVNESTETAKTSLDDISVLEKGALERKEKCQIQLDERLKNRSPSPDCHAVSTISIQEQVKMVRHFNDVVNAYMALSNEKAAEYLADPQRKGHEIIEVLTEFIESKRGEPSNPFPNKRAGIVMQDTLKTVAGKKGYFIKNILDPSNSARFQGEGGDFGNLLAGKYLTAIIDANGKSTPVSDIKGGINSIAKKFREEGLKFTVCDSSGKETTVQYAQQKNKFIVDQSCGGVIASQLKASGASGAVFDPQKHGSYHAFKGEGSKIEAAILNSMGVSKSVSAKKTASPITTSRPSDGAAL